MLKKHSITPESDQRQNRLYTLCCLPKRGGRSRWGAPVRMRCSTASTTSRWSAAAALGPAALPGRSGLIRCCILSVNMVLSAFIHLSASLACGAAPALVKVIPAANRPKRNPICPQVLARHGRVAPIKIARRIVYAENGKTGQGVTETSNRNAKAEIEILWNYVKETI